MNTVSRTTTRLLSWLWSGITLAIGGIFALCLGVATKISFLIIPAAVCGIIFAIMAFLFPYLGLVAVVSVMPFEFLSQIDAEGSLTAGKILLLLVLGLWFAHAILGRKPQMLTAALGHPILITAVIFIVAVLPSFINARVIGASYYYLFRKLLPCLFFAAIILDQVVSRQRLLILCKLYMVIAMIVCSFGIYEMFSGNSILSLFGFDYNLIAGSAEGGLASTKTSAVVGTTSEDVSWVRVMSTFMDPDLFAAFIVMTTGLAIGIWPMVSRPWRLFLLIFLLICAVDMYATGSRTAILSFIAFVGLGFLMSNIPFRFPLAMLGLVLGLAAIPVLETISPAFRDGFSPDAFFEDPRYGFWSTGLKMVKAHPILGIGLFNTMDMYNVYGTHVAPAGYHPMLMHNVPLQVLAETGIVGFFPFCVFMLVVYWTSGRLGMKAKDPCLGWFARWQFVAIVSVIPLAVTQNLLVFEYIWITIGLIAATDKMDKSHEEDGTL